MHRNEWFPPRGEFPETIAAMQQSMSSVPKPERRQTPRFTGLEEYGVASIRLRPGYAASLIDLSSGGAFFEIARRLMPGTPADLHVETWRQRLTIRGSVVRCQVARLASNAVVYRAAVAFHSPLCLLGVEAVAHLATAAGPGKEPARPPARLPIATRADAPSRLRTPARFR